LRKRKRRTSSEDAALFEGGTWSSERSRSDHVTCPTPHCSQPFMFVVEPKEVACSLPS
jgi:hypothetical protein